MDWISIRKRAIDLIKEYKYAAVILAVGLIFMLIPSPKDEIQTEQEAAPTEAVSGPDLQDTLGALLSSLEGAGSVKVLLTEAQGEKITYQTNTQESPDSFTEDTVLVTGAGKEETGLVRQVIPPKYQGAIVLCQGADSAVIRLAIIEAVSNVTGLSTDKISVLKMK